MENKKGNKLQVEFPTLIPDTTYEASGEYPITVPGQENFIPIGGIEINDTCFVFTKTSHYNYAAITYYAKRNTTFFYNDSAMQKIILQNNVNKYIFIDSNFLVNTINSTNFPKP